MISKDKNRELELTADELIEITQKTNREYENITGEKVKNNTITKVVALLILVLMVLLLRTLIKTKEAVESVQIQSGVIEAEVSDDGRITSKQTIIIEEQ